MLLKSLFALAALSSVSALNILLTNDDGWAAANIRATYYALKNAGHSVLLVAPAENMSGHGGTVVLPTTNITASGGEFGLIPPGALYYGHDPADSNIWYFNSTPAGCALWAFDIIIPQYFPNRTIDLVVSGPNEGSNTGEYLYTLSGTMGGTYASVERGYPAVAFSAGNGTHRSYLTNTNSTTDPANLAAKVVVNFVTALAKGVNTKKDRLLPLSVGINVNLPTFGPKSNCTDPAFVNTRFTGGGIVDKLFVNSTTGFPQYGDLVDAGLNVPLNGNPNLPGETIINAENCKTAVTVFATDYDAPTSAAAPVQKHLKPLFGKSHL